MKRLQKVVAMVLAGALDERSVWALYPTGQRRQKPVGAEAIRNRRKKKAVKPLRKSRIRAPGRRRQSSKGTLDSRDKSACKHRNQ